MNLNALHRRLLRDVLEIGNAFPFVITGGYAVQAHGLVDRLSRDIDVATNSSVPMASLADHLIAGLTERGWQVRPIGVDPISARFMVTDPGTGEDCEVDILKEGFNHPPEATPYGPVLAQGELESLGRRCAWDEFSLEGLAIRLSSAQWRADEEFSAYGLSDDEIADLRNWAQAWADDINRRLYAETYVDDGDDEIA
jgi:hypothetical protein